MVSMTSSWMTLASASASRTRMPIAFSTSLAARSVLGLKLCFRSSLNSSGDVVSVAVALPSAPTSVLMSLPLLGYSRGAIIAGSAGGFRGFAPFLQGPHEFGIVEKFLELVFGGDLAIHVAAQIGERFPRLQQLRHWLDLPCNGSRVEIIHLLEAQIDRELVPLAPDLVVDRERDSRLDPRHAFVEIVHVEFEEFALRHIVLFDTGIISRQIGHYPHDKGDLDLLVGIIGVVICNMHPWHSIAPNDFLSGHCPASLKPEPVRAGHLTTPACIYAGTCTRLQV